MMKYDEDIFRSLKNRNKMILNRVYKKKEYPILKNREMGLYTTTDDLVKSKVDEITKELANKYKVEEDKVYDTLYLKVRKMFLELM